MSEPTPTSFVDWFRSNAINLIVTMFLIGGAWGGMSISNTWRDSNITNNKTEIDKIGNRVDANEKAIAQTTFQVQADHSAIQSLTSDSKQLQINGARVEAQIDVVNNKLDNVSVQLGKVSAKLDTLETKH